MTGGGLNLQNNNDDGNIDAKKINKDNEAALLYFNSIIDFFYKIEADIEVKKPEENQKLIFKVINDKKGSLFTKAENDIPLLFTTKKRSMVKRRRMENRDNIRRKIKRAFFNHALVNKLNEKIKKIGLTLYFEKFPKNFVGDITRNTNKKILNMSLKEIFENKELYGTLELSNYHNNMNILKNEIIIENEEINNILNKSFSELYEEYINSKEFKIDTINRLKEKKMNDEYIEKYKYFAKNLLKFFAE